MLNDWILKNYSAERKPVAPLVGAPLAHAAGTTVKLAQQNASEHMKVIRKVTELFHPDIILPMMDLTVEANALGRYVDFPMNEAATVQTFDFEWEFTDRLAGIDILHDGRLISVLQTVEKMKEELPQKMLRLAYVTGPYTLAGLIIGAENAAMAVSIEPDELHQLTEMLTIKIGQFIRELLKAGAQGICILEPSGVMLSAEMFHEFSADYVRKIIRAAGSGVDFVYHVCGNSMHLVSEMIGSGVSVLSIDAQDAGMDMVNVLDQVGDAVAVMGNMSPTGLLLSGQPEDVLREGRTILKDISSYRNAIFSTGCDLPVQTPLQNIHAFMDCGRHF